MLITALVAGLALLSPPQTAKPTVPANAFTVSRLRTFDQIRIVSVAGAPTGTLFAIGQEDTKVRVMDAAKLTTVWTLSGHPQPCYGMAFSPDGKTLATGDDTARIFLWDMKTGKKIREFPRDKGHQRGIQTLTFSPDGKKIASVGKDGQIRIWNTAGGNPIASIVEVGINYYGAEFMPSGTFISATLEGAVSMFDAKTFKKIVTLATPNKTGINAVTLNLDGTNAILAARDGRLLIYDLKKRTRTSGVNAHSDWAMNAITSPNGRILVSSSNDMTVKFWDMKTLKPLFGLDQMSPIGAPMTFTGNGKFFVSANAGDALQVYAISPAQSAPVAVKKK
jgi:WD40 repeat protein